MFHDAVEPTTGEVVKHRSPFWEDKAVQTLTDVARPNNEGALYKDMYEYTGERRYSRPIRGDVRVPPRQAGGE